MGNTCKPMAVSFQCMTKSTTNKNLKKKKKNRKQKDFVERVKTRKRPWEENGISKGSGNGKETPEFGGVHVTMPV